AVVGVLGYFNDDDRAALILALARAAALKDLPCRFLVQGPTRLVRTDLVEEYIALKSLPHVEMIGTELDFDGYFSALFACDIVLLPYESRLYTAMPSGIFTEAVAFAKVAIVPAGTWMSRKLDAGYGAGVSFATRDATAILEALERALGDFTALADLARVRAAAWRKS